MNKLEAFKNELPYIKSETVRRFVETAIETFPDYFFSIPASSTSKYHPAYALGEGGLLRHTRAAIRIAVELSRVTWDWWDFTSDKETFDLALAAIFLHDAYKSGAVQTQYSVAEHPKIAKVQFANNPNLNSILVPEQFNLILEGVSRHMGQWNFDYRTNASVLDVPETNFQRFIHLCDYLASRKCLIMDFDIGLSTS